MNGSNQVLEVGATAFELVTLITHTHGEPPPLTIRAAR